MHEKEAGVTMKHLLQRAQREQVENIKRAQQNVFATSTGLRVPYESGAFRDLIKGVSKLLALVRRRSGG